MTANVTALAPTMRVYCVKLRSTVPKRATFFPCVWLEEIIRTTLMMINVIATALFIRIKLNALVMSLVWLWRMEKSARIVDKLLDI